MASVRNGIKELEEIMVSAHDTHKRNLKYACMNDASFYRGVAEGMACALGNGSIYTAYNRQEALTEEEAEAKMLAHYTLSKTYEKRNETAISLYHDGYHGAMKMYLNTIREEVA